MEKRGRLITSFCIGGIVGVVLVRGFFLDALEEIGWRMFWEGIGNGRTMDLGMVMQSATFAKCLAGLMIGGAVGVLVMHTRTLANKSQ
jgi:hypothetical protein